LYTVAPRSGNRRAPLRHSPPTRLALALPFDKGGATGVQLEAEVPSCQPPIPAALWRSRENAMQQMDRDREKNGGEGAGKPVGKPAGTGLLDRQLEEILRNAERTHRRQLLWRRVRGTAGVALGQGQRAALPSRLLAWGAALCLISLLISGINPVLSTWLILAGVILILSPIFINVRRGGGGGNQHVWRGRVIEYPPADSFAAGRVWLQGLLRRLRGGPPGPRR